MNKTGGYTMVCPTCRGVAKSTLWTPPRGYDPKTIELRCLDCQKLWYKLDTARVRVQGTFI